MILFPRFRQCNIRPGDLKIYTATLIMMVLIMVMITLAEIGVGVGIILGNAMLVMAVTMLATGTVGCQI